MKRTFIAIATALSLVGSPPVSAQASSKTQVAAVPKEYTNGEVLDVNRKDATVVLKHEFIQNLGMDPMAMEFEVKDRALLNRLKLGDKVRFKAVHRDGKYILVEARPRK